MRTLALLVVVAAGSSCMEPPKTAQMDQAISGLAHLHTWHPSSQGRGQYGYDAVIGRVPDILPFLVDHLLDETPTAIFDRETGRNPTVSDACFLILLHLTNRPWQEFSDCGVFVSTALPNPIFCIKWDGPEARVKVQRKFRKLVEEYEPK